MLAHLTFCRGGTNSLTRNSGAKHKKIQNPRNTHHTILNTKQKSHNFRQKTLKTTKNQPHFHPKSLLIIVVIP